MRNSLAAIVLVLPLISADVVDFTHFDGRASDPFSPREVRACYKSIPVDEAAKANTSAFHASVNYQIRAPPPFHNHDKEAKYPSDHDLHIDLSRALQRLNDGHAVWINNCYVSGLSQNVHITPEAFNVSSAEFPDQIEFWQDVLPGSLRGKLDTLSGAKVLLINGRPPFDAVNANARIAGSYQAFRTRQNGFFSSYRRTAAEWSYLLGNFAQQSLPLDDSVVLTIQRPNHLLPDTIPSVYNFTITRANCEHRNLGALPLKFSPTAKPFSDAKLWRDNNCKAIAGTNGVNICNEQITDSPASKFMQQPKIQDVVARTHLLNVLMDTEPLSDVVLPVTLQPILLPFYLARDRKTGDGFLKSPLDGLVSLKSQGATQLIVDVTNNGGGYICAAHWLHRIIAATKASTVSQAGLDTKTRARPQAQLSDPDAELLYNPVNWRNAQHEFFGPDEDWLDPAVPVIINSRKDALSQRLGQECYPEDFPSAPPEIALFDTKKVAITRSLVQITMSKYEGSKTVVQYCGVVGGQSSKFVTMDTEIKTTRLEDHPLAPPDL
ncbi:hypothetical protein BJ165DRAFT_1413781 [Panaeolus papilionaceus]|nr:hypothetical protein BJ165DRAFT_1413781 [Panaeolus papilionaceus]